MHGRRTDQSELRRRIAQQGLTKKAFHEKAGFSKSLLFAVLADPPRRDFSDLTAAQAAAALNCQVEDFTVPVYSAPLAPSDAGGDTHHEGAA